MDELWVFGYGSLMWRPGFEFEEAHVAVLEGYHRSLCVYSYVYRGTPEKPGLVLGLAEGGETIGMAFRVAALDREAVIAYLREREQVTSVYLERTGTARLMSGDRRGEEVKVLAYVADPDHEQFAGQLSLKEQERVVLDGRGKAGPNIDYVLNTVDHLKEIDIDDPELFALGAALRAKTV